MFKQSIKLLTFYFFSTLLFSTCKSTVDIDKTDFKVIHVNVKPTDRINQVADCWQLYYDDTIKAFEARQALLEIMNPNEYSSLKAEVDDKLIKSKSKENLKHSFKGIKKTNSKAGMILKTENLIDTIFSIDFNIDFGKLSYKDNSTWIMSDMNYDIRYRDNLELKDILNVNYYIDEKNNLENSFSISMNFSEIIFHGSLGKVSFGFKGSYHAGKDNSLKGYFYPVHLSDIMKQVFKDTYGLDSEVYMFYTGDLFTETELIQVFGNQ